MDTKRCPKCMRELPVSASDYRRRLRAELLALLGESCQRCAFADPRALQVDHVNGRAGKKRLVGRAYVEHVRQHPDEYQLLCANCNQIKKHDEQEVVGVRVYDRMIPTRKLRSGVGI